jgi:hypothetical protein
VRKVGDDYDGDDGQTEQYQQTDRIQHCVINSSKTCPSIDIALPVDSNGNTKENEKKGSVNTWRRSSAGCGKWGKNCASCNWSIGSDLRGD